MQEKQIARTVVVTGGASGIGAACSKAFGREGDNVVVCYYSDRDAAKAICAEVDAAGGHGLALKVDVRHEAEVEDMFDSVLRDLAPPQVLVNSAGLNMSGKKVVEMDKATWDALIDTDLTGAFLTCRRMLREVLKAKLPGRIINISSIHARAMRSGGAGYDSAKAGLGALTATLALETAAMDITVNAIAPGMILTPMNERAMEDPAFLKRSEANIPARRAGKAEEVARLAVYLASADAGYITGTTVTIDGGLSLMQALGA
jgi:glucose 1-dehydrogenase